MLKASAPALLAPEFIRCHFLWLNIATGLRSFTASTRRHGSNPLRPGSTASKIVHLAFWLPQFPGHSISTIIGESYHSQNGFTFTLEAANNFSISVAESSTTKTVLMVLTF